MDGKALFERSSWSGRSERFCTADFRAIERRLESGVGVSTVVNWVQVRRFHDGQRGAGN